MKKLTHNHLSSSQTILARMSGFSLIEMMISVTIGLFIVSGLIGLLISTSGSTKTNDRTAELQGNGRYALDHLKGVLREAGYRGYTPQAPESVGWINPAVTQECLPTGGAGGFFVKNIRQAVWGKDDANPFTANCIPSASYLRGDVLVTRSAASTPTLAASAVANTIYLRSNYVGANLYQSTLPADVNGTNNFELKEYVYYISPFTNSIATTGLATESPQVPALYRASLEPSTAICHLYNSSWAAPCMRPELVVTGIEHFQVQFGMSNSDGTTQFFDAGSVNASGDNDVVATASTPWDKISSVRIWLLARNSKAEIGFTDTGTYTMGNIVYGPMSDNFRRQVFTSVVQLRNFRN